MRSQKYKTRAMIEDDFKAVQRSQDILFVIGVCVALAIASSAIGFVCYGVTLLIK